MTADRPGRQPAAMPQQRSRDASEFSPARLRAWRHLREVTHAQLADAAHTTIAYVSDCERGIEQPDSATVIVWAEVLSCRPAQLYSTTPTAPSEYWKAANEAMAPMSTQDLAVVAEVILRSRSYRAE